MNYEYIEIFIYSDEIYSEELNNYFYDNKRFKIVAKTTSKKELELYLNLYKKIIVLIDVLPYNYEYIYEIIIPMIKNKKRKSIVLCIDINQGFDLLTKGADEMIVKSKLGTNFNLDSFFKIIEIKLNKLFTDYKNINKIFETNFLNDIKTIIAIGSSTGGTECILQILKSLPKDVPPILIVQHMPPVFTNLYSKRLNKECKMTVVEAKDGDELKNGLVLIAPGSKQMKINIRNKKYFVTCRIEKTNFLNAPSADVLFTSIAEKVKIKCIGIILTGMGKDGAEGLLKMRKRGFLTIGQEKNSCTVYGMPKVAYDIGAVAVQAKPEEIAKIIMKNI